MTEPQQGLSYAEILAAARAAEAAGLEAFFRADHLRGFPGPADQPTTDAWTTLAGLARETSTIRVGVLVSPVTFRIPGNLAKVAATVDEMSGGRVEVGLGAGWNAEEHAGLGIPFPPLAERYDRYEEALAILHGLWTQPDGWSFDGRHWQVTDALFRPRPMFSGRRHPHLILGGNGGPRQARLVATFADEFNRTSATPELIRVAYGHVRAACAAIGRDPDEVVHSAMVGTLIGETENDVRDRIAVLLEAFGDDIDDAATWLAEWRKRWIMGTLDQAAGQIRDLEAAGAQRIMLQTFVPRDLDMIALMGRLATA
jgi:F420-dependent oxidoreductase-like protein